MAERLTDTFGSMSSELVGPLSQRQMVYTDLHLAHPGYERQVRVQLEVCANASGAIC